MNALCVLSVYSGCTLCVLGVYSVCTQGVLSVNYSIWVWFGSFWISLLCSLFRDSRMLLKVLMACNKKNNFHLNQKKISRCQNTSQIKYRPIEMSTDQQVAVQTSRS